LINREAIRKEFEKSNNGRQNISVYLYEDFLAQYDKLKNTKNRKEGGVYYTPKAVANFIVGSVEWLIKDEFNSNEGFLSEDVKVLDFASGTGTFLHSVFESFFKDNGDNGQAKDDASEGDAIAFQELKSNAAIQLIGTGSENTKDKKRQIETKFVPNFATEPCGVFADSLTSKNSAANAAPEIFEDSPPPPFFTSQV
jgi:hypothetical protein